MSEQKEVSFDESLVISEAIIQQIDGGETADSEVEDRVGALVASVTGARGFLVTLLTGDFAASDDPPAPLVRALERNPSTVCDLLAKNMVMSSTMAVTHERNGDEENARGSRAVRERTAKIIQAMRIPEMRDRLEEMWKSVTEGEGAYVDFLKRWQYDEEQLERAAEALAPVRGL